MGILHDDPAEDIKALEFVTAWSAEGYNYWNNQQGQS